MKKILFVLFVLMASVAFGQGVRMKTGIAGFNGAQFVGIPPGYTKLNVRYEFVALLADSGLHVPQYNGTPSGVRTGVWVGDGAVAVDTTNSRFYIYSGGAWVRVANYSEIGGTYTAGDGLLLTGTEFKVLTKRSITIDNDSLMLVNDSTASPVSYFYGTNVAGRKGWYAQSGITGINLYNSDGTLTGNRTVDGGGFELNFDNLSGFLASSPSGVVQLYSNANSNTSQIGTHIDGFSELSSNRTATATIFSQIAVKPDSIIVLPYQGIVNIDSLRTWTAVGDTTYKKPMTWDTRNGRWEYASNWFGGGSGSTAISSLTDADQNNSISLGTHQQIWASDQTTGVGLTLSSSTITSGSVLSILNTSTALAANNEALNIAVSGANGTNAITATGARISVTNTNGTSGTNVGLDVTASGATTANNAIRATGNVLVEGTGNYFYGRWRARVDSTTSSGTPTINTDNVDVYKLTAQAADITSFTTNLSGTPQDGDILELVITGTAARAITWGASFVSTTVTLPATTVTTATLTVILQYYKSSSYGNNKWHCVNYY